MRKDIDSYALVRNNWALVVIYMGIDPGKGGGIALLSDTGRALKAIRMPGTLEELFEAIEGWNVSEYVFAESVYALVEDVHSSPQMGVASSFTFGRGYGHLEMALTAARVPFERVRPIVWQTALKCRTAGDKNVSKDRAARMFPRLEMTHAIADALLIAEYARRSHQAATQKKRSREEWRKRRQERLSRLHRKLDSRRRTSRRASGHVGRGRPR